MSIGLLNIKQNGNITKNEVLLFSNAQKTIMFFKCTHLDKIKQIYITPSFKTKTDLIK